MFRFIWTASVHTRHFLRRYMPTNILLDAIRTRRGLKWGGPAMLLVVPYLYVAGILRVLIEDGGPGWLHVLVLVCVCYAAAVVMPTSALRGGSGDLGRRHNQRPARKASTGSGGW